MTDHYYGYCEHCKTMDTDETKLVTTNTRKRLTVFIGNIDLKENTKHICKQCGRQLSGIKCVSLKTSNDTITAFQYSAEKFGFKKMEFINEIMAGAVARGVEIFNGDMIVEIEHNTIQIVTFALGGIINYRSVDDNFAAICFENLQTIPYKAGVDYTEIAKKLDRIASIIETMMLDILEHIPLELASEIRKSGIFLFGENGPLLRGLSSHIKMKTGLRIHFLRIPLNSAEKHGVNIIMNDNDKYSYLNPFSEKCTIKNEL